MEYRAGQKSFKTRLDNEFETRYQFQSEQMWRSENFRVFKGLQFELPELSTYISNQRAMDDARYLELGRKLPESDKILNWTDF